MRLLVKIKENEWENSTTAAAARGKIKLCNDWHLASCIWRQGREVLCSRRKNSHTRFVKLATNEEGEGRLNKWMNFYICGNSKKEHGSFTFFWWYVHGKFIHMAFLTFGRWCEFFFFLLMLLRILIIDFTFIPCILHTRC